MLLSDNELEKTIKIVVGRLRKWTLSRSFLVGDAREYRNFLVSVAGEGTALALQRIDGFDAERAPLSHWCYLHARRIADQELVRKTRVLGADRVAEEQAHYQPQSEDPFDFYFCSQELSELFQHLTREQTIALVCVHYLGYSVRDTAVFLRRKENAVHALLHRGKEKARQVYRDLVLARKSQEPEPNTPSVASRPRPRSSLPAAEDEEDNRAS